MTGGDELETFVAEGMRRYPDARDAVDAFEREIQDRLCRAFEQKNNWLNFRPARGGRGRGKALFPGVKEESGRRWMWAAQNNQSEDGDYLSLELWWRSSVTPEGVVLCCRQWAPVGINPRHVQLPDPMTPVACGLVDPLQKKTCLYILMEEQANLDEQCRILLAEMDRVLGG